MRGRKKQIVGSKGALSPAADAVDRSAMAGGGGWNRGRGVARHHETKEDSESAISRKRKRGQNQLDIENDKEEEPNRNDMTMLSDTNFSEIGKSDEIAG